MAELIDRQRFEVAGMWAVGCKEAMLLAGGVEMRARRGEQACRVTVANAVKMNAMLPRSRAAIDGDRHEDADRTGRLCESNDPGLAAERVEQTGFRVDTPVVSWRTGLTRDGRHQRDNTEQ